MREKTENWLCEMFAADISVGPVEGSLLEPERRRDYRLWVVSGLTVEFLLVTPRPGVRNPSVLGIAELVHSVRERSVRCVAYGTGALSAVERKRLLVRHVPFVVAGRQVFLPFLGIALRADSSALDQPTGRRGKWDEVRLGGIGETDCAIGARILRLSARGGAFLDLGRRVGDCA